MTEHYMIRLENFDLKSIAESGQCFRMTEGPDGSYKVIAGNKKIHVRQTGKSEENGGLFEFGCSRDEFNGFWKHYFDLDTDYGKFAGMIDETDEYLKAAAGAGRGIRILHQDPFEMVISFIISQRKSIPAIKTSIEKICARFGEEIGNGDHGFPSPEALALADADALAACSLGYRTKYVHDTAYAVYSGQFRIEDIMDLEYSELVSELKKLPGVGDKVANCIGLFGCHRLDAFPRDVWIIRTEKEHYGGHFDEGLYPGFAGVMQQYMFYYERYLNGKIRL